MKCKMYPEEDATVQVTYGMYSGIKNTYPLCERAAKELWDKCSTLVNLGQMHWLNKSITNNKNESHK